ncbi:MAG TPA: hypothetical protein VNI83_08845 [Vicinamibacterales bacterium]|nr:hypothetical protein [Vicinamibacterales bacterium]
MTRASRTSPARRGAAGLVTAAVVVLVLRRVPAGRLAAALAAADYGLFLAAMLANTIVYVCWDTLVLARVVSWFHGPTAYRTLLPVRAASYVAGFFNTNAGRGLLAVHLARRVGAPVLQSSSTVLFLVFTEYLHLVAWAAAGMLLARETLPAGLPWIPPATAAVWLALFAYTRLPGAAGAPPRNGLFGWLLAPRGWALLRTFRLAPARRYAQVVLLRAPMFFVSLCLHYAGARAFHLELPFGALLAGLPVIFMIAALPITVARVGTTQAAWVLFFAPYAPAPAVLAFSLAAHLTFVTTRALVGLCFLPRASVDLLSPRRAQA